MIAPGDIILFQGDSITDCGRSHEAGKISNELAGLGQGYALMVAAQLLKNRPSNSLQFYNRGISGHRIVDLYARIQSDFIQLRPTLVSILVGVNDTWHERLTGNGVSVPKYERIYRDLLVEVREALPTVKLVLCEPFVLNCGVVTDDWITEIAQRREVVGKLAVEFGATRVPFQSVFDRAIQSAPPEYWAPDGVHPSAAGHKLMADAWLQKVEEY